MKSKTIRTIACIISLVAILSVTGIFTYLTDAKATYDKFTIGQVRIEIEEPSWQEAEDLNDNGIPDYAEKLVPNTTIKKDPQIINVGENSALVYFKVKVPVQNIITAKENGILENSGKAKDTELFSYSVNNNWEEIISARDSIKSTSGKIEYNTYVYYYKLPLEHKNDRTQSLFDKVKFANLISNELDENIYQIGLEAYAIQAENLPESISIEEAYQIYINQEG